MSKIRAFVAVALISIPMLSLDAAELQAPQEAPPLMSDSRPTIPGFCVWINGWPYCF